ncbi:MAG TPA: GNAT family N-acetyltransferase [Actinomycetota bacterium]|nr:GNAT family N-acetyltransferase [Actinomycetota bacterium]
MAGHFEIRAARAKDSAILADAWREFGRYYAEIDAAEFRVPDDEGLAEWFASRLTEAEHDDASWLVAERDGMVIGFVQAQIWRPAEDAERQLLREVAEPILKVDSLMVLEDERGAGVATTLMRAVEDWGIERGATRSVVIAALSGSAAVGFYENRMRYERKTIGFSKRL